MQVFHLPHPVFCRDTCACVEMTVVIIAHHPRTGERASKRVAKRVPGSITILARERKAGLPNAILDIPEVKAALGRGYLRVVEQSPDTPAPAPSSPQVAAPPPSSPPASAPVLATVPPAKPPEGHT
jgi:hypothetical protein